MLKPKNSENRMCRFALDESSTTIDRHYLDIEHFESGVTLVIVRRLGRVCVTRGNFLAIVALVAQYDEVLSELISLPSRATKYLSATIQNELITLLGTTLRKTIIGKIDRAPFWSVILDTTSDITRRDQLSVVIRWVHVGDEHFEIRVSFLGCGYRCRCPRFSGHNEKVFG